MSSMPQRVAVAVDEVMAIFPHLATAYVHVSFTFYLWANFRYTHSRLVVIGIPHMSTAYVHVG